MERNTGGERVVAVDRALVLLTLLGGRESLTVTDAAHALEVAPSTAHRLLTTLVGRGFAVQDRQRRYAAGPALLLPGQAYGTPVLVSRVRPYLEQLYDTTRETCHVMVREGTVVRFVDGIEGTQALRVGIRTGMRMTADHTSGGKAMLADLDSPGRGAGRHQLGLNRDESEPGVTALGASLGVVDGHHAALTVAVPTARLTPERTGELSEQLVRICDAARHQLT